MSMQILLFFLTFPSIIFSTNFCVNCKFYIPSDFRFGLLGQEFGKCKFYYNIKNKDDSNFLVTGYKKKEIIDYYYCTTCRTSENMCGEEGKQFINKCDKLQ